jgi:hypothetical protein
MCGRLGKEMLVPTLMLTNEQVVALAKQLPVEWRETLFRDLLSEEWGIWTRLHSAGQDAARNAAARRGTDWDKMTEEQREALIDQIVHEDRPCGR